MKPYLVIISLYVYIYVRRLLLGFAVVVALLLLIDNLRFVCVSIVESNLTSPFLFSFCCSNNKIVATHFWLQTFFQIQICIRCNNLSNLLLVLYIKTNYIKVSKNENCIFFIKCPLYFH